MLRRRRQLGLLLNNLFDRRSLRHTPVPLFPARC